MEAVMQKDTNTSSAGKWILIITVLSCAVMELIDSTAVGVARAQMMGGLGITSDEIAWIVTAYALGNVITVPLSAMLSSLFGRKIYFTVSVAVFTISSFLCGLSDGLLLITVWRFVQGLAGGALLSTAQSIIADAFPPEELSTATAVFGMGMMLGPTIGPVLGGYITDALSWQWIFFINIPIGIVGTFLCWKYVPDLKNAVKPQKIDILGIIFMIIGLCSLQYFLEEGMQKDWFNSTEIKVVFVTAIVGLTAFIWRELSVEDPAVKISLYRNRSLAISHFMNIVLGMLMTGLGFIFPLFVQITLGWTATRQGVFQIFPALASAVAMLFVSKYLLKKTGYHITAILGIVCFAIYLFLLSKSSLNSSENTFITPFIIQSFGKAMLMVPLMTMALVGLRGKDLAQATGLSNIMRQLGAAIGVVLVNIYVQHQDANVLNAMTSNINLYNPLATQRIASYKAMFESLGYSADKALSAAYVGIEQAIHIQMHVVSYDNMYLGFCIFMLLTIPLMFLIKSPKSNNTKIKK